MEINRYFKKLSNEFSSVAMISIASAVTCHSTYRVIHEVALETFKNNVWVSLGCASLVVLNVIQTAYLLLSIVHLIRRAIDVYNRAIEKKNQSFFTRNFNYSFKFIEKKIISAFS